MKPANRNVLKDLAFLLREAEQKSEKEKGEDSLDNQIDALFSDYEADSRNSKNEGRDFRGLVRRFLLEAEEDEDKKAEDKKAEDKTSKKTEVKKLTIDDIDVDNFMENVVRLVDNYDSLLEVRNTILRRAINYLLKGYEPDVADAFKESLIEMHGIQIGKTKSEMEDENFQPPAADRAGASPGSA